MTCEIDLSCPQPENFAAIAKQLHQTAVQAEERIYCQEQLVRAALNRPTAISRKSVDSTFFPPNFNSAMFAHWNDGDYTPGFVNSDIRIFQAMRYPAGIYQIGMVVDPYPTGLVTPDSQRVAIIEIHETFDTLFIPGAWAKREEQTLREPDNGLGNLMTLETVQRVEEGNFIAFKFYHDNVSDMRMQTATTAAWVHKISDLNVTQVL